MSFWMDIADTKTFDVTLNSMKEGLKHIFEHSDYNSDFSNQQKFNTKYSKLNNKPKKHVTFCIPSDDQNHDNLKLNSDNLSGYKSTITQIMESDVPTNCMYINYSLIKIII